MALTTGYLIADRYRLSRRIAVGGMGEVWEADDTRLDRRVAVKVLKPELSGDAEFRHRFHTEARTTASLNHPGIAAVHDYGEVSTLDGAEPEPDTAYLVMEFVAGEPLAAILHRHPRLAADRTLDILGQCAEALQAAHARGLVHRDIKPGNILITPEGLVKLTDFGIAKAADAAPVTRQGMVMGTAHYIAPEQATGEEASSAGDVYSLGVVGYECLAGWRPFRSDNAVTVAMMHIRDVPPPLPPDVPPAVRELIDTTLVKDPRQRYATGKEFALAVAAVRAGRRPPRPAGVGHPVVFAAGPPPRPILVPPGPVGLPHPPTGPYPHPVFAPPRRTGRVVAAVVAGLLVVGLVVILVWVVSESMRDGGSASMAPGAALPERTVPDTAPAPGEPISTDDYVGLTGTDAAEVAVDQGWEPRVVDENGADVSAVDRDSCRVIDVESPRADSLLLTCVGGGS